jgi:ribonuclease HI
MVLPLLAETIPTEEGHLASSFRKDKLYFYTDGSVYKRQGGWGVCVTFDGLKVYRQFGGFHHDTTIARMEMKAVISSLYWMRLHLPRGMTGVIYCDSKFVVDAINEDWLGNWQFLDWTKPDGKMTANVDLWKEFITARKMLERRKISWEINWIKAHDGRGLNDRVDEYANLKRKTKAKNPKYD